MTKICLTNFKPISTCHVSKAANRNGPCLSLTARAGKLLKIDFVREKCCGKSLLITQRMILNKRFTVCPKDVHVKWI